MADDTSASILTLHQPRPKAAKTPAQRANAYRLRKKAAVPALPAPVSVPTTVLTPVTPQADLFPEQTAPTVTFSVTPSRRPAASYLLVVAALSLGAVGITMNGWFARSLWATETAGWLFLAVGVAADLVALTMPSRAWQDKSRATALAGWVVWLTTFILPSRPASGLPRRTSRT